MLRLVLPLVQTSASHITQHMGMMREAEKSRGAPDISYLTYNQLSHSAGGLLATPTMPSSSSRGE